MGKRVADMTPEEHARVKEQKRLRYAQNPEPAKEAARAWRLSNKERADDRISEWRKAHPERVRVFTRRKKFAQYGLTEEQYQELFDGQGGVCAVCGIATKDTPSRDEDLTVDHDHLTGKVRGLTCRSCNRGIGLLGDTIEGLEAALAYLRKYEESSDD